MRERIAVDEFITYLGKIGLLVAGIDWPKVRNVKVNGKTLDGLIDTGAQTTVLSYEATQKLDLKLETKGTAVGWSGRPVPTFEGKVKTFEIGSIEVRDLEVSAINAPWECIIGWDILERLGAAIDYKNKVIYLKE